MGLTLHTYVQEPDGGSVDLQVQERATLGTKQRRIVLDGLSQAHHLKEMLEDVFMAEGSDITDRQPTRSCLAISGELGLSAKLKSQSIKVLSCGGGAVEIKASAQELPETMD
eukprot:9876581-Karenia_brevis.AAC.1